MTLAQHAGQRPRAAAESRSEQFTSRDGLFSVDMDQRIRQWSDSAQVLLGVQVDVIGRRCFDVLCGADDSNARYCRDTCPVMTNAQRGRGTNSFDIRLADGDGRPCVINVSILLHRHAEETQIIHLFRDVTSERLADQSGSSRFGERVDEQDAMTCALTPPTQRQLEVVRMLAGGLQPERIASALGVSPVTVRNHIQGAMERLGAHNRVEVIAAAARAGLL